MIQLKRTDASDQDFIALVRELDAYLKIIDGDDHAFYNQYNGLENIKFVIVAYVDDEAVGCGTIKKHDERSMEIKRMYVKPGRRGTGIASKILKELEIWAKELRIERIVLETGSRQVEAVRFYHKSGYNRIPNYGQYAIMKGSKCFEKFL